MMDISNSVERIHDQQHNLTLSEHNTIADEYIHNGLNTGTDMPMDTLETSIIYDQTSTSNVLRQARLTLQVSSYVCCERRLD